MKYSLLVVLLLAATVPGCRKANPDRDLPPPSQSGENFLACLIDGKARIFEGVSTRVRERGVYLEFPFGGYMIVGTRTGLLQSKRNIQICIDTTAFTPFAVYQYLHTSQCSTSYDSSDGWFKVSPNDPFNFLIFTRIDDEVAAGTFQFRAFNTLGEPVVITHGRFDIAR